MENKRIVALGKLSQQQDAATKATNDTIDQLLDFVATYPSDSITYCVSDMVLSAQFNAAYLNASKACSRVYTHIMLLEDIPVPSNRPAKQ